MNEPSVTVPASIFLHLARLYKQQSQEDMIQSDYFKITNLEQRAHRILLKWEEGQK
jgi:hypothetical protein